MKNCKKETDERLKKIDSLPRHLAIIMDGNGRWAQKRGRLRAFGHQNAVGAVRETIESAVELGIDYLTLYAFSTENWERPRTEVSLLMKLFRITIDQEMDRLHDNNICFKVIGEVSDFPKDIQKQLRLVVEKTRYNTRMTLTIALSYGGQRDIQRAMTDIAQKVIDNEIEPSEITQSLIKNHLYTRELPDIDLLIRTSGEYRISNFMLWDIAYTELYFTEVLWPDFSKEHLIDALIDYQYRERRFGNVGNQKIAVK